jgi:hypothetical protein
MSELRINIGGSRERRLNDEIAALHASRDEWTNTAVQRGLELEELRAEIATLREALTLLRPYIEREAKVEKSPWAIVGMMHIDAGISVSSASVPAPDAPSERFDDGTLDATADENRK